MPTWLLYPALPLFSLLPGVPIVLLLGRPRFPSVISLGEFLFRGVLAGFLLHSAVALVLAEVGLFSWGPFLALEGALGLLLAVALWRRKKAVSWPRPSWEDLIPLGLLVLAALLLGTPHPAILGGSDPGAYVGIAANMVRTGSLQTTDPVWASMDQQLARDDLLFANMPGMLMPYHRLPGYYALDTQPGTILPQFYHLYPLWLALSLAVAGFPGGLFITPILAGWALVAIYYAGRAIAGRWVALAAGLLVGLNPLFIWLGRHPISEVPAQFLLFSGVYALAEFLRSDEHDWAAGVLAGAALGALLHTRVDSVLALVLIGAWLAFRLLASNRGWSTLLPFLLPLGVALAHWGLYLAFFTWGYTIDALGGAFKFLLAPIVWPVVFLGALGFVLLVLLTRRGKLPALLPALRVAVAAAILPLAGFAWFIWPRMAVPQQVGYYAWNGWSFFPVPQGQNFLQLAWYLSPLGLALGIAGFCLFVLRSEVRRAAFLSGLVLLYGLFYTYSSAEFPVQPYVMRRQFVVVIPGLLLMAGYALYRLARSSRIARVVSVALLLLLLWVSADAARLTWQVNDFTGIPEQLAGLAKDFSSQDVLLFTDIAGGTELAFPLQYLYQRSCFVLQRPEPDNLALLNQVEEWEKEGRHVFVLAATGASRLSPQLFSLQWLGSFSLHWQQLEPLLDRPPTKTIEQEMRYNVYRLDKAGTWSGEPAVDMGAGDYPYLVSGFWGPEQMPDGTTFRWTNGDATIELPGSWFASSAPLTLTLELLQAQDPAQGPFPLEVRLDGELLARLNPDQQMREYALPIPSDLRARLAVRDSALLRLSGSSWVPAEVGMPDTRRLGVMLNRIAVQKSSR